MWNWRSRFQYHVKNAAFRSTTILWVKASNFRPVTEKLSEPHVVVWILRLICVKVDYPRSLVRCRYSTSLGEATTGESRNQYLKHDRSRTKLSRVAKRRHTRDFATSSAYGFTLIAFDLEEYQASLDDTIPSCHTVVRLFLGSIHGNPCGFLW